MSATVEAGALFSMADELLVCVSAQLAETEAGLPDRASVVVGSDLVWDECECGGLLAVQLLRTYPADRFPELKRSGPYTRCEAVFTVAEYKISVLRCVNQPQGEAEAPTPAAMTEDAIRDFADREAVMRGVRCCFHRGPGDQRYVPNFLIQEQLAIGEGGMCAGSELHVFVAFNNCREC